MAVQQLFVQPSTGSHAAPSVLGVSTKAPPGGGAAGLFGMLLARLIPQQQTPPALSVASMLTAPVVAEDARNAGTVLTIVPVAEDGKKDGKGNAVVDTPAKTTTNETPPAEGPPLVVPLLIAAATTTAPKLAENPIAGPEQGSDQEEPKKANATTGKTDTSSVEPKTQSAPVASVAALENVTALAAGPVTVQASAGTPKQPTAATSQDLHPQTNGTSPATGASLPNLVAQMMPSVVKDAPAEGRVLVDPNALRETTTDASNAGNRPAGERPAAGSLPFSALAADLAELAEQNVPTLNLRPTMKTTPREAAVKPFSDTDGKSSATNEQVQPKLQMQSDEPSFAKMMKTAAEPKEQPKPATVSPERQAFSPAQGNADGTTAKPDIRNLQGGPELAAIAVTARSTEPTKEKTASKESAKGESAKIAGDAQAANATSGQSVASVEKSYADGSLGKNASHQQPALPKMETAAPKEHVSFTSAGTQLPPEVARDVVDQVAQRFAMQVQGETSEIRIALKPESLGDVSVKIRMEDGKMQAQIDVSQVAVKSAIESQLPQLRQALQSKGIDVQRIDVYAPGESASRESRHQQHGAPKRRGGKQSADVDPLEQYQSVKMFGYNTMEVII